MGDYEAAEAKFAQFRKEYPGHQLYWFASTQWAKCTTDPDEGEKRFKSLLESDRIPPEVKSECEMELANLAMMEDTFDEAEKLYSAWLADHPADERGEAARFWRGLCLREMGRDDDAAASLEELEKGGRQPSWRAMAGILLGSIRFGQGNLAEARRVYRELAAADWAKEVRPQALLGCANSAASAGERTAALRELASKYPGTEEAAEGKALAQARPGKKVTGPRWGVQVGAYSRMGNATAAKKQWEAKGKHAAIAERKLGHLALHIVVIGPFGTREAAEREARAIKTAGSAALVTTY